MIEIKFGESFEEIKKREVDVIIIGAGPAGLTAGMYSSRALLDTVILEKDVIGGQLSLTEYIEDYPGFPDGIKANDLINLLKKHAENFGTKIVRERAIKIELLDKGFKKVITDGGEWISKAVIVATGAHHKKLGVKGENELMGKGVSNCAVCDGPFFKDKEIVVVGGGDSAITEGLFLTRFGKKVYIVHRRDKFRAQKIYVERAKNNPKINFILDTVVEEIKGEKKVEGVVLRNLKTNEVRELPCQAVFIFIGLSPNSEILEGLTKLDERKGVITNQKMETDIPGIYAAGDVRSTSLRQAVTASSDGAIAAMMAESYIAENF
ncbi:MAG: thioredoxin-disulfide reductase [Candidatus Hydrothermales bacterium]